MENSMEVPQKIKNRTSNEPAILLLGIYLKKMQTLIGKDVCTLVFIAALFTIAKIYNNLSVHHRRVYK